MPHNESPGRRWRRTSLSVTLATAVALAGAAVPARTVEGTPDPAPDDARNTDVVERTESRLVQLDVTVTGPPEVVADLGRDDFKLKIADSKIQEFDVDRVCRSSSAGASLAIAAPDAGAPVPPRTTLGPTTFLFYFDQVHLTLYGRQRSIDLVRRLLPRLIVDGNRGMIVSNADGLATVADLTEDRAVLDGALDRLEKDRNQWHLFAASEEKRIREVLEALAFGIERAVNVAKLHYADELWRAERDFRRFAMTLGRLTNVDAPKVVVYLADNMRINAGEHYVRLLADPASERVREISRGVTLGALTSFDRVVDEASSHGVRLYTIQAEGMTSASSLVPSTLRERDAQNALDGLALETGGRSFLNGVRAEKIADRILEDLSCLYLVSFSPSHLPRDVPLAVKLKVRRQGVQARVRGRVVIQSASARLTSRLLAAFGAPGPVRSTDATPVKPTLIPTGYLEGSFRALLQVAVPRSDVPVATWDLGASVVSRGDVQKTSGRLTVSNPDVPVVLQYPIRFEPGPFELVAVAHNVTTDAIASRQLEGAWPRPDAELASFGPIAVLQVTPAAISRSHRVVTRGLMAYDEDDSLRPDRPTALVTVVCRSRDLRGTLVVERTLHGGETVTFPGIDMAREGEACAIVRDLIPVSTMTAGAFRYELRALERGRELARAARDFSVAAVDPD